MKTTGIFTTHHYTIRCKLGETVNLIPFGDIHRNAPLCSEEYWLKFLEIAKENNDYNYYLGMGDYDDLASSSEREMFSDGKFHESTTKNLDKWADEQVTHLYKELEFMKGRVIGMIGGNHYWDFQSGDNSDMRLSKLLETKFLGVSSFIRLSFAIEGTNHFHSVDIWAHHGRGASRLIGGSINGVEKMRECGEADIYICGHDHRKAAVTAGSKLELVGHGDRMKLRYKKQWLVRSGSFLRGYVDGEASYVTDGALPPCDLGVVRIELTPRRSRIGGEDVSEVDIHCWS